MNKRLFVALMGVLWLSGCATMNVSQSGLYWGKYSHTLYELKKNPGAEARAKHIAEINEVIAKSKEMNLRVPPGLYAEMGMYSLEDGKQKEANQYFNLELSVYPESKAMVNQILKKS
ncbi:MAG: DUF4810 domain-containing protein [Gammaproteobacteria bacterium]|nr:DUF4810 domain-containing protein [Gammaproteobacteria bacterium]